MYTDSQFIYKKPIYLKPIVRPIIYANLQANSYKGEVPVINKTNGFNFEQYELTNYYNQVNDININSYTQENINQINPIYSLNEENHINSLDTVNEGNIINYNNQFDYTNFSTTNNDNQIVSYNEYDLTKTPYHSEDLKQYTTYETTNQNTSYETTFQFTPYEKKSTIYDATNKNTSYANLNQFIPYETTIQLKPNEKLNQYTQNNSTNVYVQYETSYQFIPYTQYEKVEQFTPYKSTNQITSYYQDNSNNIHRENEINEKPIVSLVQNTSDNQNNKANEVKRLNIVNPINSVKIDQINGKFRINQINQISNDKSFNINASKTNITENMIKNPEQELKINMKSDINKVIEKEFKNEEQIEESPKKIDSPILINPLVPPMPLSPIHLSINEEEKDNLEKKIYLTKNIYLKENNKKNTKKRGSNILTSDEKALLENERNNLFNIKSHYDLVLIKEPNEFNYKKVLKAGIALLSHFEMPQNYIYKSPILSPNGKYLSCIAQGKEDFVYVWDVNDLYWYKYKFSSSKVDGISFTPDSNSIIIVYRYANPSMYNLSNGKKIIELEGNGEEKQREGFQCSYTINGTHFAYTTDKSFTLWSLRTGEIKQQIIDDSPIKIISNQYLICISNDLNVLIKRISTEENVVTFKLKGVESTNEILDARCTDDMSSFLYVIKEGIIRYIFNNKEYKGVQKFLCGVDKAKISEDCKYVLKTNMKNISIYNIEKKESICTLLKEKFKEFRVFFHLKKIVVIDDISIHIQNYEDDFAPQKYVWLDKNPTKFEEVKFSRNRKILLARINRNKAIAYNLQTGYILKKWQNFDENWLDYAMTKYGGDNIATKSHLILVKVWNFASGKELASFYGYNSHSFSFSGNGLYLACGTTCGSEIARIWDINNQKYGVFRYNGTNNNFHTVVHLTSPKPDYLICCTVDQQPLVFNTHTREFLFNCECPYRFEEIYAIQSDLLYNVFIVKGKDVKKRNIGILYKMSDGSLLETYENYSVLELAKNNGAIVVKCDNINGGKLTSINIKNLDELINNDFQIQTEKCKLLEDNAVAVIEYGDNYNKEFNLINIKNGNYIGKIHFLKKNDRKSAAYLTVDPYTNEIFFRYLEFLSPQETMIFKKNYIFKVEDE